MYRVGLSKEALKYYNKVSVDTARRLDRCFVSLESAPLKGPNIKSLTARPGQYRYRVGTLRVIYEVDTTKQTVFVVGILPRGQAYKQAP